MINHSTTFAHRMQNEQPKLTFEIISDLHITLPFKNKRLDTALNDQYKRNQTLILILGDLSSHGLSFQLDQCFNQLKKYPFQYLIALGNHDTYSLKEKNQIHIRPLYKTLSLKNHHQLYYEEIIKGIHFLVLNSEKPCKSNTYLSRQQLFWVKDRLTTIDAAKPVFVLCHHPLKNSHIHSDQKENSLGYQSRDLLKILSTHPHVIYLSGHIHNSYEECIPHINYPVMEIDVPAFSQVMFGAKRSQIGYQIQVYNDFLYLRTRDYKQQEWIDCHEYIFDLVSTTICPFDIDQIKD